MSSAPLQPWAACWAPGTDLIEVFSMEVGWAGGRGGSEGTEGDITVTALKQSAQFSLKQCEQTDGSLSPRYDGACSPLTAVPCPPSLARRLWLSLVTRSFRLQGDLLPFLLLCGYTAGAVGSRAPLLGFFPVCDLDLAVSSWASYLTFLSLSL